MNDAPNPAVAPWPIIGHERVVARLARAAGTEQVAHAYLFSGPDGVGKRTLARTFGQALLCTSARNRPCGTCRACQLVGANRHPDFLVLDMAWQEASVPQKRGAQSLSVDAVRQMSSDLYRRPLEGRWKVLLVPNVDDLTLAASNAFLKTLEEPPSYVVILLTTRDPDLLLPTIRSRCQPVTLRPLGREEVARALRVRWGQAEERARLLARLSGGRIGWAIAAAQSEERLDQRAAAFDALRRTLASNRAERLLLAGALGKTHDLDMLRWWAGWWRDVLLLQNGAADAITNVDQQAMLAEAAARYPAGQVRAVLHDLQHVLRLAQETNANATLLWEVLLLKLPH